MSEALTPHWTVPQRPIMPRANTTTLERLQELETWMRKRGVKMLRLPDGLELQLGPEPPPVSAGHRKITDEQRAAAKHEREQRVMYASTSIRPRSNG